MFCGAVPGPHRVRRNVTGTGALAGSADAPPVMATGAKGPPTSLYDDYEIVVH